MKKVLKENLVYIIIIIFLILLGFILYRTSIYNSILSFDNKIAYDRVNNINSLGNDTVTKIFKVITFCGNFDIPFFILVFVLIAFKNKWKFLTISGGYAIGGIITYITKILVRRPRPGIAVIAMPSTYSFPSGHTLNSIIFYVLLAYVLTYKMSKNKRLFYIILAFIFSLLIAFSRFYLGVHYITDIIGGIILAVVILLMCFNIIDKHIKEKL